MARHLDYLGVAATQAADRPRHPAVPGGPVPARVVSGRSERIIAEPNLPISGDRAGPAPPAHGERYRACLAGGRHDPGGLLVVAAPG